MIPQSQGFAVGDRITVSRTLFPPPPWWRVVQRWHWWRNKDKPMTVVVTAHTTVTVGASQ